MKTPKQWWPTSRNGVATMLTRADEKEGLVSPPTETDGPPGALRCERDRSSIMFGSALERRVLDISNVIIQATYHLGFGITQDHITACHTLWSANTLRSSQCGRNISVEAVHGRVGSHAGGRVAKSKCQQSSTRYSRQSTKSTAQPFLKSVCAATSIKPMFFSQYARQQRTDYNLVFCCIRSMKAPPLTLDSVTPEAGKTLHIDGSPLSNLFNKSAAEYDY
ncbi:hypothetical protein EDD37DRAFT_693964 [Exophiala viscosa]|uniref:uncharacterized protein n=1 Tax=Exophiala viscosa TaxID=2486360 RepID=UPI00219B03FB|nr:hypothetical protein EDD37DRAFT_693964 [Exophiala viscosa]